MGRVFETHQGRRPSGGSRRLDPPYTFSHASSTCLLHFSVRDTGIGIPIDKQRLIFEPFSQADGSTTRKYGGTGLGLAISSQLVEMMGGRIWVESEMGQGSTFHFTLPFGRGAEAEPTRHAGVPPRLRDLAVLVVDDNATNRRILKEILTNWHMRPTVVDSGEAALTALQKGCEAGERFPLVLLDCMMPGMDGFMLAAHIKARHRVRPADPGDARIRQSARRGGPVQGTWHRRSPGEADPPG